IRRAGSRRRERLRAPCRPRLEGLDVAPGVEGRLLHVRRRAPGLARLDQAREDPCPANQFEGGYSERPHSCMRSLLRRHASAIATATLRINPTAQVAAMDSQKAIGPCLTPHAIVRYIMTTRPSVACPTP